MKSTLANPMLKEIEQQIEKNIPADKKEAYKRLTLAAGKMLFDEKANKKMRLVKEPASRETPAETISEGAIGLTWLLYVQSKKQMPPEVLVPGCMVVACWAMDFAERGLGIQITPQIISATAKLTYEKMFEKLGVTPEQLRDAIIKGKEEIDQYQSHKAYLDSRIEAVKTAKKADKQPVKKGGK